MISNKGRILFCLFIISISLIHSAWAINLPYINKAKVRLSILPGESKYGELIVDNPTPEAKSMRLYLEDWYYIPPGDGPKEFMPPNTTSLSCAPWITFSPQEFTIAPFGRQNVGYTVKVPAQAKGGYYAALFFESMFGKSPAAQDEQKIDVGINLAIRIASLFYIEAEGTIKRTAEISNLAFKKESAPGPLLIQMDLLNSGNVDITAGGSFHFIDKDGIPVARGEFKDMYTFPGDTVKLTATWKETLPVGKYDAIFTIDIGKALEEAGVGRGPVITKEAQIEIGKNGEVIRIGELK